ncbi:hypothetical protein B9Z55_025998 [Caenorhabditis nigoni]|uniref:Uncharacterized protein n=1 Tax=Caenorhabditis nigoni TaxID=1611254 RepID=A0A2G5T0U0_9PELO|nr:hypothetical protein B9Z55_025998 [Caenorhabditis nigoni]
MRAFARACQHLSGLDRKKAKSPIDHPNWWWFSDGVGSVSPQYRVGSEVHFPKSAHLFRQDNANRKRFKNAGLAIPILRFESHKEFMQNPNEVKTVIVDEW